MPRIYFLAPDIGTTQNIVDELRSEGIEDNDIHILAKRDTPLGDLPEAGVTIKTDFLPAVERGAALGGSAGLLAGVVGLQFAGYTIAGGPVLGIMMAGTTISSLAAGLIGMGTGNSRLKQYEEAIEKGELLILIDIPEERIEHIRQLITKQYPDAAFEGVEPVLPPAY